MDKECVQILANAILEAAAGNAVTGDEGVNQGLHAIAASLEGVAQQLARIANAMQKNS